MPMLKAIREVRYASVTYRPGDTFEASDKDAKILKAVKKAEDANDAPKTVDLPNSVMAAKEVGEPAPLSQSYLRRDMRAEGGQTGEAKPSQSSHRGRPRKARTSNASEDDAE